jgi:hypothetical protein
VYSASVTPHGSTKAFVFVSRVVRVFCPFHDVALDDDKTAGERELKEEDDATPETATTPARGFAAAALALRVVLFLFALRNPIIIAAVDDNKPPSRLERGTTVAVIRWRCNLSLSLSADKIKFKK